MEWPALALALLGSASTMVLAIGLHTLKSIAHRLELIELKLEQLIRLEEKFSSLERRVGNLETKGCDMINAPHHVQPKSP